MNRENVSKELHIKGMFCSNCENRVRKALCSLPGVSVDSVSYEKESARISYDPSKAADADFKKCIENAGYEIGTPDHTSLHVLSICVILFIVWFAARHFGWLQMGSLIPDIETSLSIGALFLTGILTSVHCVAMCGGINLTQSVIASKDKNRLFRSNALYQVGRILSYTLIGGIVGGIGQVFSFNSSTKGIVMIIAGAAILVMALNMLGVFKILRRLRFGFIARRYSGLNVRKRTDSSFIIGLLNGLMPCGPLQSMQIYALSTGSAVRGALSMLSFSLGTVPLLLGFGLVSGSLNRKYKRVMLNVSAFVILIMALNLTANGLSLLGLLPASGSDSSIAVSDQNENIQLLRTEIDYGSYPAIQVKAGIPVKWTIVVPEGKLTGCNREIIVPAFGLDIVLQEGENIVEFTADEPGIIPYSCWMGMIRNTIEVLE